MSIILSPSILSADFSKLGEEIQAVERGGAQYLHIDVMDGHFVPNISYGQPVIKALRPHSKLCFDVHLMIQDPLRYIDDFCACGADIITFHLESTDEPQAVLRAIHENHKKAGVAIKPVSYTHLDVYKRQHLEKTACRSRHLLCGLWRDEMQRLDEKSPLTVSQNPVVSNCRYRCV